MNFTFISIMAAVAALSWWVSGFDPRVNGQNKAADLRRRAVRCGITLLLVGMALGQLLYGGVGGGFVFVIMLLPLAPFWMGCVSELSARGVMGLVDREDDREFDPKQIARDLDRLAGLVREGKNHEAVELCRHLLDCNGSSALAIESTLFDLYRDMFAEDRLARSTPLAEALRLRAVQAHAEAAGKLEALLKKEPRNLGAAFLLMRIQAADLRQAEAVDARLQILGPQSWVPPAFVDYTRRCVMEWTGAVTRPPKTDENIESFLVRHRPSASPQAVTDADNASPDELLAAGQLTRVIEVLESRIKEQPQDFDSWLKLAETHGAYCRDFLRAGKVIDKIVANPAFDAEQVRLAKAKLREWKSGCAA